MWCEKLKSGKYRYAERYLDPLTLTQKKVSVTLEKNTRQAQKTAQQALNEKIRKEMSSIGINVPKKVKLSELVEYYRADQEHTVKKSTWLRNYWTCETLMRILGPDTMVGSITAGYIRKQLLATRCEPGTLNEYLKRLKALLRWGYRNDYVSDVRFLDKLEPFKDIPHRQKIEDKFLEREELKLLLQEMTVPIWQDLTAFLALSGLRFGEAAALLRSDLDLRHRIIHVTKTYDSLNDLVTSPKSYHSVRDVYMQDELYELCRRLLASGYIDANIISINSGKLLFPYTDGQHIYFDVYAKYLRENSEKVLGRRITPHVLRHTHASLMMEQGLDIDAIANRLGHYDSRITREIYLHVTKRLQEKQNAQIRNIKILAP